MRILLRHITKCRRVRIWARDPQKARACVVDSFDIEIAKLACGAGRPL